MTILMTILIRGSKKGLVLLNIPVYDVFYTTDTMVGGATMLFFKIVPGTVMDCVSAPYLFMAPHGGIYR
jgi:altronate dehydratase